MAGRSGRALVALAALTVLAVSGCQDTVTGTARPAKRGPLSPTTQSTTKPNEPAGSPEKFLLGADEVNDIMGTTDLAGEGPSDRMTDNSAAVSDPSCVGTMFNAEETVYDGTGWTAVADQILTAPDEDSSRWVEQTVVAFPSPDKAVAFFDKTVEGWTNCIGKELDVEVGDSQYRWRIEGIAITGRTVQQTARQTDSGGWACDHVLSADSGYIIETAACGVGLSGEAATLARRIADKIG
jgi:hypothetical protein